MQIHGERLSWFKVPKDVKELLIVASQNWENPLKAEDCINKALAKTGDNTDVLVAVYRYFYYKNNYLMALQIAAKIIDIIKKSEKLPDSWEQLKLILMVRKEEPKIRLFLTAYAASGLVSAKLGEIEQAKEISTQIKEIDDKNEFGSALLLDILTREDEL